MNNLVITTVLVPGFVSLLLFLVFTYLYEQSRQQYFRAWQLAWAAYSIIWPVSRRVRRPGCAGSAWNGCTG